MTDISGLDPTTGKPITVSMRDGLIHSIAPGPAGQSTFLAPGLIDLQVNGYGGFDLNAETLTPDTVIQLARALAQQGVTTFFPTLITQSEVRLLAALHAIATARNAHPLVHHMIAGIHMEGPSISPANGPRGAHPAPHIRPPSLAEFDRWQQASNHLVKLVTLSPHFAEAPAYIAALHARGIAISIGHTDCTLDQLHRAIDAGASLSTHLGNGIAATLPRHPNLLWTQLADDRLTAMLIADGHHLPPDVLTVILRTKPRPNIILVSDSVALGGMPPGTYTAPVGGQVTLTPDGRLGITGSPLLAGASLPLRHGVAHLLQHCRVSLPDALSFATINPGRVAGNRGTLTPGSPADIIRFTLTSTSTLNIEQTLIGGRPWS